ncbi:uncharacterized protein LOC124269191 [Haliotis rubra]|uniref:uncharacterized protein LOC124269191 n=1 Tax=Haliotis rubra TaxID=36100 RepID=UPI001EE5EED5|nr:uncharacterized protein LOC124269191 [Haliotis rubra]
MTSEVFKLLMGLAKDYIAKVEEFQMLQHLPATIPEPNIVLTPAVDPLTSVSSQDTRRAFTNVTSSVPPQALIPPTGQGRPTSPSPMNQPGSMMAPPTPYAGPGRVNRPTPYSRLSASANGQPTDW